MLIDGFPAEMFATNCWVIAPAAGEECIVIDPGIANPDGRLLLDQVLTRHRLKPVAVIATHGHLDHTFSIGPICGARGIPAYIHSADRELLAHPERAFSVDSPLLEMFAGLSFSEPDQVVELVDGLELSLAGLDLKIDHAPGHTAGSIMIRVPGSSPTVLTGDVLFAGAIGRTDLPTGSASAMRTSLRKKVLTLSDDYLVLPGHGPRTTIGAERDTNPYLTAMGDGADDSFSQ
ncbi:MAG TPA: MBL fold metallo-hydrolase [Candidatus Nanopelagicaceae bacterium]|nr:MBL fold metallo-hydrolase [Candidatus Nanopelagicaceae bacterium]